LVAHRTMLAEMGFVDVNACLYDIGATAQLTAAPKAAISPIKPFHVSSCFKQEQ
jgi:hypothetical protein